MLLRDDPRVGVGLTKGFGDTYRFTLGPWKAVSTAGKHPGNGVNLRMSETMGQTAGTCAPVFEEIRSCLGFAREARS